MANPLSTDLYEFAMTAGYASIGLRAPATFELSVRELPPHRNFLIAAGIDQAVACLETLAFDRPDIEALRAIPDLARVPAWFFEEFLPAFRFSGDVWAVAEGTPVFADEPILRVTAPLAEAQLVETALLAIVGHQTSVASKAVRSVVAAGGRPVIEFGSRRAHGLEAAVHAARAAYLAGCAGTSNVEAGARFDIPVLGTMAHSWVMAMADEAGAFRTYQDLFGERAVLLIDTYDVERAARLVVSAGLRPAAVRIDSGDLAAQATKVRQILDAGGCEATRILASGDLDEDRIAVLVSLGAPVDGFGVGTAISTSRDAPALAAIYKLVERDRGAGPEPVMKLSRGKRSWPGRKQVWRTLGPGGQPAGDILACHDEPGPPDAEPLLGPVMTAGRREGVPPALPGLRRRCLDRVSALPAPLLDRAPSGYPVAVSAPLERLATRLAQTLDWHARGEVH